MLEVIVTAKTILVTSGKGGTGKTTISALLAKALTFHDKNVLLIELDSGLRGLDILFGISDKIVYDLSDVLNFRCKPVKAITTVETHLGNLHLIPAPMDRTFVPDAHLLLKLLHGLSGCYDYVIMDTAAGLGKVFDVAASICDLALLVVTCDAISIRDGAATVAALDGIPTRLVVNKFSSRQLKGRYPHLDAIIDTVGAQLISVVPFDEAVFYSCLTSPDLSTSLAQMEVVDMASRLLGHNVTLNQKRLK